MGKVLITAALPYANANLHLGHLRSTYIPSDIYARYLRSRGEEVAYICATDEHGTPIAIRAEREDIAPKKLVDKYYDSILKDLKKMGCSFDEFGRTTSPLHYEFTQEFFSCLLKRGYIYKDEYEQLYCSTCQRFLPDRFVEGLCPHCLGEARGDQCESCGRYLKPVELKEPRCVSCENTPENRKTEHWFFKLSLFKDFLEKWLSNNQILPSNVKNYSLKWIHEDLIDWCITRDLSWGVPVPLEGIEGKVIYVWFDAPIGYISTTVQWAKRLGDPKKWRAFFFEKESKVIHFIGKDIIYHHSIFWPAMLEAHGDYNLPFKIVAGEYLTLEGKKMSKSRGWSVEVEEYLKKFEVDPLRYYLIVVSPLNKDADFRWEEYIRRNNDELADIFGNFIHRTLMFTYQFFDCQIPQPESMDDDDNEVFSEIVATKNSIEEAMDEQKFHKALRDIINLAAIGNKYLNHKKPWKTLKVEPQKAATTLYVANQLVKALAIMIEPFMPLTAEKIWLTLKISKSIHVTNWEEIYNKLQPEHKINKPKPLFVKIAMEDYAKNVQARLN